MHPPFSFSQRPSSNKNLQTTPPRRTGPPSREAASNNIGLNHVTAGRVFGAGWRGLSLSRVPHAKEST